MFDNPTEPALCLSSIGTQLRLSREAIRQIEAKAPAKILHPVTLRKLVRHCPAAGRAHSDRRAHPRPPPASRKNQP